MAAKKSHGKKKPAKSGHWDTITFIYPNPGGVAKVWLDGGENYICVEGNNALDSEENPLLQVAIALYTDNECPTPDTFPGTASTDPPIYTCDVNSDGSFEFPYFVPGAIASIHPTQAPQKLACWVQHQDESWSNDYLECFTFYGQSSSQTDCGTTPPELHSAEDEQLAVTVPRAGKPGRVIMRNGRNFICVRGSEAFDPEGNLDFAVAAKVYGPDEPIPDAPPFCDLSLRVVNVDDDGNFAFDTVGTLVPGAEATIGTSGARNVLAVWPLFIDGSSGSPTTVPFLGCKSPDQTDCGPVRRKQPCAPCHERQEKADKAGKSPRPSESEFPAKYGEKEKRAAQPRKVEQKDEQ